MAHEPVPNCGLITCRTLLPFIYVKKTLFLLPCHIPICGTSLSTYLRHNREFSKHGVSGVRSQILILPPNGYHEWVRTALCEGKPPDSVDPWPSGPPIPEGGEAGIQGGLGPGTNRSRNPIWTSVGSGLPTKSSVTPNSNTNQTRNYTCH